MAVAADWAVGERGPPARFSHLHVLRQELHSKVQGLALPTVGLQPLLATLANCQPVTVVAYVQICLHLFHATVACHRVACFVVCKRNIVCCGVEPGLA